MDLEMTVSKRTYAGLFVVTLATLMYEILLTRIFSVTMWYHYAFVTISIALFGMTVGALLVYIFPNYFSLSKVKYQLGLSALLFALLIVVSFLTHLSIPFITEDVSVVEVYSIVLTYIVISTPFFFSGICVSLALTKFPQHVGKLYAADLLGAAFGCVLVVYILKTTDGPTAVVLIAFLASIGAIFFISETGRKKLIRVAVASAFVLALFSIIHTVLVNQQSPWLRIIWVKGHRESRPLYEKWNSFSRVRVNGDPTKPQYPFGWGLSPAYVSKKDVIQLHMNIDAAAGTVMTAFDGNLNDLDHLKYDIVNIVHYIRDEADVLVVGTGGGRDILSALAFEQNSVTGIEINEEIIGMVTQTFGDFTGHLDEYPQVTFINDEARSYIARSDDKWDIIQISLIDSWAATAAGAFVLSENSLYTTDAWDIFLNHLKPGGVLTVSRWYFRDLPAEMYRMTSLASTALTRIGVENPRDHIIIIRRMRGNDATEPDGIGTILVSKEPFSAKDIDAIEEIVAKGELELVLTPRFSIDNNYDVLTSPEEFNEFITKYPLNITPPTDDSPFFFHTLRFQDIFNQDQLSQGRSSFNIKAVYTLGILLITVLGLTVLCIIVPLALTIKKETLKGSFSLFVFFAGIGFGFMLVEISQMQRLIIFLGHPTYSLSMVLFTLLLSSGLGSYLTQRIDHRNFINSAIRNLLFLIGVLVIFGIVTPYILTALQGATTPIRILAAVIILFPLGIFMGMAFPLGMRVASSKAALTPWLWGINGATSVCASVLAVVIAMNSGISTTFWVGSICYIMAVLAFILVSRKVRSEFVS